MSVQDAKGVLDKGLSKLTSRKLLVWLVATGLLVHGSIDGDQWQAIALAYVGTQAFIDTALAWKHGRQ
tara:strand:+ start:594 stop:797 length:204 start_codon:yes stop_codon:yes gene_type:complete